METTKDVCTGSCENKAHEAQQDKQWVRPGATGDYSYTE